MDCLGRGDHLDQTSIVEQDRRVHGAVALLVLPELSVRGRSGDVSSDIEPGQWTDAIDAVGIARRLKVGELQIRVIFDGLADVLAISRWFDALADRLPVVTDELQASAVMFPSAVVGDERKEHRWEVAESLRLFAEVVKIALEKVE